MIAAMKARRLSFVFTLGVLLSLAVPVTAFGVGDYPGNITDIEYVGKSEQWPDPVLAPVTVKVSTEAGSSKQWTCDWDGGEAFVAGSDVHTCQFNKAGFYNIANRTPGQCQFTDCIAGNAYIEVIDPADQPCGADCIRYHSGSTTSIPSKLSFSSEKRNLAVFWVNNQAKAAADSLVSSQGKQNGRYQFEVRIPFAPKGPMELRAETWGEDRDQSEADTFQVTATNGSPTYTGFDPSLDSERDGKKCQVDLSLQVYAAKTSTWRGEIEVESKQDGRWRRIDRYSTKETVGDGYDPVKAEGDVFLRIKRNKLANKSRAIAHQTLAGPKYSWEDKQKITKSC